ncbi:unnamed protein product [Dibothriocephalus latus]|uniref:Homeobox domain-containing protein n=1 Tax=Dibothriocephalus latus TaxID=60516 RepID=A0A3P7QBK8_DIBLA|nr:unnamed protein product [Dibothriocephalus latus]
MTKMPCSNEGSSPECFPLPTLLSSPSADGADVLRICRSAWAFVRFETLKTKAHFNGDVNQLSSDVPTELTNFLGNICLPFQPPFAVSSDMESSFDSSKENGAFLSDSSFQLGPFRQHRKPKRIRTAFSPSQLLRLENAFETNHYVVGQERKKLAESLSLTETQVRGTIFRSGHIAKSS